MINKTFILPLVCLSTVSITVGAESSAEPGTESIESIETTQSDMEQVYVTGEYVTGGEGSLRTIAGSAHIVDQTDLEKFDQLDIHQVVTQVPGVYVRSEDGYGLRPNIGMRGATAERSQKITLMEDGVLIGPAPYSAPAAYYFPNVARMSAVEIFKGPVAIEYGPNTIGGAVNLVSTPIPNAVSDRPSGQVKAAIAGGEHEEGTRRLHAHIGQWSPFGEGHAGWLLEGLTYHSDGFKSIDHHPETDTGFERNDLRFKLRFASNPEAERFQMVDLIFGYANERANETYLGLSDADFAADPTRRYAASHLDRMAWDHHQFQLRHLIEFNDQLSLTTRLYHNEFTRNWRKLDSFRRDSASESDGGLSLNNASFSIAEVLANPTGFSEQRYYRLLTGDANSNGTELQKLDLTENDRDYLSRGIEWQLKGSRPFQWRDRPATYEWRAGLRLHNDSVERHHSVKAYEMLDGTLVFDGIERDLRTLNKDESDAVALYVNNLFTLPRGIFSIGLRGESIESTRYNYLAEAGEPVRIDSDQSILMPGMGGVFHLTPTIDLLAGVYRGFSPVGPGDTRNNDPETSTNYEIGARYFRPAQPGAEAGEQSGLSDRLGDLSAEAILFFNDYKNVLATCRVSDGDACDTDENFSGGEAQTAGLEASATTDWTLNESFRLPIKLTYTYSESAFQTSFTSDFSQWGDVQKGDEFPYLPEHQLRLDLGISHSIWELYTAIKYNGTMRETAGQGPIPEADKIDDYVEVDLSAHYWYSGSLRYQFKISNLFDEQTLVARRPLGARPNRPRTFEASISYYFE